MNAYRFLILAAVLWITSAPLPRHAFAGDNGVQQDGSRVVLRWPPGPINALAVSPDGKVLLSAGPKGMVLWNVGSRAPAWTADGISDSDSFRLREPNYDRIAVFSPDSRYVAISRTEIGTPTVETRSVETGQVRTKGSFEYAHGTRMAFDPNSQFLALATSRQEESILPTLYYLSTGLEALEVESKARTTFQMFFSGSGELLVGTGEDWREVREKKGKAHFESQPTSTAVWDARTGKELLKIPFGQFRHGVALSRDGKLLAAANASITRLYAVPSGRVAREIHSGSPDFMVFTADGTKLITASYDRSSLITVQTVDLSSGELRTTMRRKNRTNTLALQPVMFSITGQRVALLERDGLVRVFDTMTGQQLAEFHQVESKLTSMAFFPDQKRLAVGEERGLIAIYPVGDNK